MIDTDPVVGYSQTSLARKLGLINAKGVSPDRAAVLRPPPGYAALLDDRTPPRAAPDALDEWDWLHAFYTEESSLRHEFPNLKDRLATAGQLWISWPKKSSGRQTSLTENLVREIGLAAGLVDVKVAAVDETWSALKFVRRLVDR